MTKLALAQGLCGPSVRSLASIPVSSASYARLGPLKGSLGGGAYAQPEGNSL